jgi:hypothetical protein
MALKDTQPFVASRGFILTGPVGTAKPTQAMIDAYVAASTPITGLTDLGHTNREGFLNDGTEATTQVRGSYQNKNLQVVTTEESTEFVTTDSLQVTDRDILKLYYGAGTATAGEFSVPPASGASAELAMLLIRTNGTKNVGEWFPKVSIQRNGPINWQVEDFALVPFRFTALQETGQPLKVIISGDIEADTP